MIHFIYSWKKSSLKELFVSDPKYFITPLNNTVNHNSYYKQINVFKTHLSHTHIVHIFFIF